MRVLSDEDVRTIRVEAIENGAPAHQLAARYGVDPAYIRRLCRGETRRTAGGPLRNSAHGRRPRLDARGFGAVLDAIPDLVEELGPFEYVFTVEPDAPTRALLRTLGVAVVVDPAATIEVRKTA